MRIVSQVGQSQVLVEERPQPKPKPGEVVVKTVVSALCGSEMSGYRKAGYPTGNMGHEGAGIVVELGAGVTTPSLGQRVGGSAIAGCGNCEYCRRGQYTWCGNYQFYDNMHAEYFVIAALACHVLPDDVPWDVGVLITGDGLGVPYHTSTKIDRADIQHIAVFGLGPVGLGNVMFQTHRGRQVIGIDRSPERLELARQLGAIATIAVEDDTDVPARVRDLTHGRGADVCIEAAGVPVTAKQCFAAVRTGGTVVFNGEQPAVELSPSEDFIRRDITAVGSWFYHFHEYAGMLDLFRNGLPIKSLITHRFPLEQASAAYRVMEGKSGKVLLDMGPVDTKRFKRLPTTTLDLNIAAEDHMTKTLMFSPLAPLRLLAVPFLLSGLTLVARAADTPTLPAVENLVARQTAFESRNSPATLDQLGRDFLARTYIGTWDPHEFNRPGGWEVLKEVRARMDRNDFAGALDGFKNYTLGKLRNIDSYGLPRARFDPFSSGAPGVQWIRPLLDVQQKDAIVQQAQQLMAGIITVNGKQLDIGPPGTVNWKAATATASRSSTGWPWDFDTFYPLMAAYIYTGEQPYMDKWAAYADDWAMNQHEGLANTNIAEVPDQWVNGVEIMLTLLRYLGGVAAMPNGAACLPAPTFARVFARLIDDFIPVSILYHRSNPQNWNDASLTALPDVGYFMDDYPIGRQLLQESRRRLDLLLSTHHLLDGTELDSTVGYSNLFIIGPGTFLQRIDTRQLVIPDWMLTKWEKEDWRNDPELGHWEQVIHAEMLRRARSLTAHTMASGEWPIGGTRDGRHNESQRVYNILHYFLPDAFQNPDIANILALSTGRRADGVPSFTSERFPYGGHAYIRAGWGATDPYLYMYAAPYPLTGSLSVRNNNAIGLSAYGYDLLETGENGVYDQPHTPVKVDGQEQYFPFGISAWGHRGQMVSTSHYTAAPNWRWHASAQFNVAEGVYTGNFGKEKALNDVTHQRLVHYVREAGVWIVTDRLQSPQPHHYTLDWRFGIKPGDDRDFTADQITVQATANSIKTVRPGGANVSLYHFPSSPVTFTTGEERTPPQGYRLHDFLRVSGDWTATGDSVVVTAIYPRRTPDEELTSIKSLSAQGVEGFDALTPRGTHVLYQAATVAPGALRVAGLTATGESLLLTIDPDGTRRGVALGCKALLMAGKPVPITAADFEFEIAGGKLKTTTIYTPLQPVVIAPSDTTAFVGQQVVTFACPSPNSEIRYTLDGSDPTPASPLYHAPITLTATTTVKARSFRPGTTQMPTTMSGTLASVVTAALYDAAAPTKAVNAPATVPGLHYDYYEGRWQDLLSGLERLKPIKSGAVDKLFDISPKGTAPTYAFQYAGYFEAPADGIYNFTAPPEYYEPSVMAGYELRLSLDGKLWYPATSRHALGTWSVNLQKGKHALEVYYADLRADGVQKMNRPGQRPMVWDGTTPDVQLSGPGLPTGPIPAQLLSRAK